MGPEQQAFCHSSSLNSRKVVSQMKSLHRIARCLLAASLLLVSAGAARSEQMEVEVASAEAKRNFNGDDVVAVTLTADSGREFAAFSRTIAGRMIEVRSGNDVLSIVRLQTSILGGIIQLPVRSGVAVDLAGKLSAGGAKLHIGTVEAKK